MHHAAGDRAGFVDFDSVPHQSQVMRARKPTGTGADDEDALARGLRGHRRRPALLQGAIA